MRAVLITESTSPNNLEAALVKLGFNVSTRMDPSAFINDPILYPKDVDLLITARKFDECKCCYLCRDYDCAEGEHIPLLADIMPNAFVATYQVNIGARESFFSEGDYTGRRIITVNDVPHPTDILPIIMPVFARYINYRIGSLGRNPRRSEFKHWTRSYNTPLGL